MRVRPRPSVPASPAPPPRRAYHPTRAEQETILRWDREDDQVHVWTASPVNWRKLERLGITPIRETRFPGGAVGRPILPDSAEPVPLGAEAGRGQGPRTPRSCQACGVDASSDTSEPRAMRPDRGSGVGAARTRVSWS
jgi:hypothetical protein